MASFIDDDFMLQNDAGRRLYHETAADLPIYDYHCHLPPKDIADNRRFANLHEAWLEGDHYKWRAMRANGVDETYITGEADPYDKFLAWSKTVPATLRNPLYHWTHLELKRYFGIDELLSERNAKEVWDACEKKFASEELSAQGILRRFKVNVVGTTDDPTDDLAHHRAIADAGLATKVYPAFRPDKAIKLGDLDAFGAWTKKLEEASGVSCSDFDGFLKAIEQRHDFFHSMGSRLSDHGIEACYAASCSKSEAAAVYAKARSGEGPTAEETEAYASFMMLVFGRLDAAKGWAKQLHVGAMRNNRSRLFEKLGPDTGFDSIGDYPQGIAMARYLDRLDAESALPKTVVYNLNPSDNYLMASMMGNFQDGVIPGKMQFGSGWWFLDQKEGMTWQINALSNIGLLSRFVGMLTDSRSFLSYPRHEYFRRILCNLVGADMEAGEAPMDFELVGSMVADICYRNAVAYFGMEPGGY